MTPLARSLLALVALLAAADAVTVTPKCHGVPSGNVTGVPYVFTLPLPPKAFLSRIPETLKIPDKCSRPGREIGGQYVVICSFNGRPQVILPVYSSVAVGPYDYPIDYSDVEVSCPGCDRDTNVRVFQYCKMFAGPN